MIFDHDLPEDEFALLNYMCPFGRPNTFTDDYFKIAIEDNHRVNSEFAASFRVILDKLVKKGLVEVTEKYVRLDLFYEELIPHYTVTEFGCEVSVREFNRRVEENRRLRRIQRAEEEAKLNWNRPNRIARWSVIIAAAALILSLVVWREERQESTKQDQNMRLLRDSVDGLYQQIQQLKDNPPSVTDTAFVY